MPSPTAHIFYGQEYLARHLSHDPGAFLRGTIFPDIRYPLQIERSRTHVLGVSLNDVRTELDPWRAGMLFHCWLDEVWPDYFAQWGLDRYDHAYDVEFTELKLIEDDQLQKLLTESAVAKLAEELRKVDEQPLKLGFRAEDVAEWNTLVSNLISQMDSAKVRREVLEAYHIPPDQIKRLEQGERRLGREKAWQDRVRDCRRVVTGLL